MLNELLCFYLYFGGRVPGFCKSRPVLPIARSIPPSLPLVLTLARCIFKVKSWQQVTGIFPVPANIAVLERISNSAGFHGAGEQNFFLVFFFF